MEWTALNLKAGIALKLYRAEYSEALPPVRDAEIKRFLAESPLEVTDGALSSGQYRARRTPLVLPGLCDKMAPLI